MSDPTDDGLTWKLRNRNVVMGREGPSETAADFYFDNGSQSLTVKKALITDIGDPPDSAMRRIGPDGAPWDLPRSEWRRVPANQNCGTWYWQAICALSDIATALGFVGRLAQIYARTRGDQTPTSSPGSLHLGTTPDGHIEPLDRLEIEKDGTLSFPGVPTQYDSVTGVAYLRVRTEDGQIRRLKLE